MDNIIYIFLFACIGTRIAISMIARNIPANYLPIMALFTSIISIGFLRGYLLNTPKIGAFGNKVWWQNYRIIHSFNFGLFSILAVNKNTKAWIILFIDACLGLLFFINKYFF